MASNSFGQLFKITTWGESHGKAIGVVIDGCPAGIELVDEDINAALKKRAPGRSAYVSPRKEPDIAEIYSGVFEGRTTGAPISVIIMNKDHDSSSYEAVKELYKPGHANYAYLAKYGRFDYRGGGRASARETACRVAAAAVANKILLRHGIRVQAYLHRVGDIAVDQNQMTWIAKDELDVDNLLFCPDACAREKMQLAIEAAREAGDSLGGVVGICVPNMPVGLGDPIYEKLEANLAKAMLSLPASKGFELGDGFVASTMLGSQHNDLFAKGQMPMSSNHSGGTLAGISTGMPLLARVAFKPTSSIRKPQATLDIHGSEQVFELPKHSRHDPCVAIRAVPVVAAMCSLVLVDALLMNQLTKIEDL